MQQMSPAKCEPGALLLMRHTNPAGCLWNYLHFNFINSLVEIAAMLGLDSLRGQKSLRSRSLKFWLFISFIRQFIFL